MSEEKRIKELEIEIEQFNVEALKRQQQIQQLEFELQQINEAVLTRKGGVIELRKLVAVEEKEKKDEPNTP